MGWDTSDGMAPDIGGNTALASRLVCATCWTTPKILKAHADHGQITVTVECHGQQETKILQKSDLVFTAKFFRPMDKE